MIYTLSSPTHNCKLWVENFYAVALHTKALLLQKPSQMLYPIGKQEFKVIRRHGFAYVDKTEDVYRMALHTSQYFLSRPRRFGKSLFISTLKELFSGDRGLFEGLWIEPRLGEIEQREVFHLSFNVLSYKQLGLEKALLQELKSMAKNRGIQLFSEGIPSIFGEIIKQLSVEKQMVVLIDEYDKPIIDYLDDFPKADANREILKSFYSVLKSLENHIHLLFITGVSKFSKVSHFFRPQSFERYFFGKRFCHCHRFHATGN